ncbi:MAG TPA: SOS response-associated peptidase [Tepidisphaeraceae bacterium]|nr:SOS response-associated peptidase [Tepidisphaeraceae bacterium]
MCGRYVLKTLPQQITEAIAPVVSSQLELFPRFNIAPSQSVPVVSADAENHRRLSMMRWGLIPAWAQDASIGNRLVNARSEGVLEKPAFRQAFAKRRCLIPADGFYEWAASGKRKQPYFICRRDRALLFFAGLWERWKQPGTEDFLESMTILTTGADRVVAPIHDRMPVIIAPSDYARWLDRSEPIDRITALLEPEADSQLIAQPVSSRVNMVANDGPELIEPIGAPSPRADLKLF